MGEEKRINPPIHQGGKKEKSSDSKKEKKNSLDVGKLGVGLVGLGFCGQYLYPTIFSVTTIATVSSVLVSGGTVIFGGVIGGLAVSYAMDKIKNAEDEEEEFVKSENEGE